MKLIIDIIGWTAAVLILWAYYLISRQKIDNRSVIYHIMNLIGGVLFIINLSWFEAWPLVCLNVVWVIIAINGLRKIRKNKADVKIE